MAGSAESDGLVWVWPLRPLKRTRRRMSNTPNGVRTEDEPGVMRNVRIAAGAAKPGAPVHVHHLSSRRQMPWTILEYYCPSGADVAAIGAAMPDLDDAADVPWNRVKAMLVASGHEAERLESLEAAVLVTLLSVAPGRASGTSPDAGADRATGGDHSQGKGRRPKRTEGQKAEDEGKIAAYLIEHPDATRDQIAGATGIAPGHVSASRAWKTRKAWRAEGKARRRAGQRGIGGVGDPETDLGRAPDDHD